MGTWLFFYVQNGLAATKTKLAQSVSIVLHVPERTPEQNYKNVRRIMDAVTDALALLDSTHFLGTSQTEWSKILTNEGLMRPGLSRIEAKMVAHHIKEVLANPVSED